MSTSLTEILEEVWDDGNCTGLDGWVGPGRGSAEIDSDALYRRDRMLRKAVEQLTAAGFGELDEARARAYDKGYGHGRHDQKFHPPMSLSGTPRPEKSHRNPYRRPQ